MKRDDSVTNDVVAVVVTYNRKALLTQCVVHLMRQKPPVPDILIVDNASTDGTRQALAPLIGAGSIRYVNTGANLGGAGGFQYGIRLAAKAGYKYIWIMDDDAMPMPDALEALLKAASSLGEFGYLSGRTLWTDGTLCRMNVQRDLKLHNIKRFDDPCIPSGAATFVSLLIPSRVVRQVGLPIGEFFLWADDLEYTRRISRQFPCYVIPESVTVHNCETNNGGNISTDTPSRIERYRYAYRNEVYVYRREGFRGVMRLILRTPLHIMRVLFRSRDKKRMRIRVILGGTLKGLSFKPSVEYLD